MKNIILLFLLTGIIYTAKSQSLNINWATQIGGQNWDIVSSVTELSDGNIALAGAYYDSISIAGAIYYSKGSRDCFLAILNTKGEFVKTISFGGEGYEYIRNLIPAENGGMTAVIQYNDKMQAGGQSFDKKGQVNYAFTFFDKNLNVTDKTIIASNKESRVTSYQKNTDGSYFFSGWFEDSLQVENKHYNTQGDHIVFSGSIEQGAKLKWFNQIEPSGKDKLFTGKADKSGKNYILGTTGKRDFEGSNKPKAIGQEMVHLFVLENTFDGESTDIMYPIYGIEVEPVEMLKDRC
jgi:WD40 repeat protein